MNIFLAQMEVFPGQPERNLNTMRRLYSRAVDSNADIAIFPELAISGYLLGDLWEETCFVQECMEMGSEFAAESMATAVAFGNVIIQKGLLGEDGRPRKYNAGCLAQYGRFVNFPKLGQPFIPKILLPNYREFEDSRHFYSLRQLANELGESVSSLIEAVSLDLPNAGLVKLGVQLCEDGWDDDYNVSPTAILAAQGASLICNLSASPFTKGKSNKRERVFRSHAIQNGVNIAYVNQVGVQNNGKTLYSFDGNSAVFRSDGSIVHAGDRFCESYQSVNLIPKSKISQAEPAIHDEIEDIYKSLHLCLKRYMDNFGIKKVVIGASGGIDSAVAASLYATVVGPENLILVNMPSRYNSEQTISAAADLARNLGCATLSVSIEQSVALTKEQIHGAELQSPFGVRTLSLSDFAMENIQARDRSSRILAAVAAAEGAVFTSNANKAEITVGYSTLYGDHGGFLAALGDLWKHEVYALGHFMDEKIHGKQVIPQRIYDIIPSAELSDKQNVDLGMGDPLIYWYHDRLFRSWVEHWNRAAPEDLLQHWINGTLDEFLRLPQASRQLFANTTSFVQDLEKWWKLFKGLGVVKRIQSPPVLAVSRRSFGFDYRESLLGPLFTRRYLQIKTHALNTHP